MLPNDRDLSAQGKLRQLDYVGAAHDRRSTA